MEIRQLKAFVTVAEELNFTKAALRLNMSQPPLTRLIHQLEFELGVSLFTRSTRQVELTGAGLHLLKKSRNILSELEQLELEVRSLHKKKTGKLVISMVGVALHSIVPRLISSFKQQYPKVAVEVIDSPISSIKGQLKTGRLDMAFGANELNDSRIESLSVQTHELGLLIPSSNPLSQKKSIKLSDLEGETLIFHGRHEHLGFQKEFLSFLESKGIRPKVYYKKPNESCPSLVMLEKGLLITSYSLVHGTYGTKYVPFADYSKQLKIYASWTSDNESLILKSFIDFLDANTHTPPSEMDYHLP